MGNYTALEDPLIDQTIENHMRCIVESIVARMPPQTIALRGSFGRGEGSVMPRGDSLYFLSDYEIDVATPSPFYRSVFSALSKEMTEQLGVQTGIRWMRPDCLVKDRIGPFPIKREAITISLYEFRYGSRVLFGDDFISNGPVIDPRHIRLESGFQLLLNRMAESLSYMSLEDDYQDKSLVTYHWINKTILACAEALLLLWESYHFSYRERGVRFAELAQTRLGFMQSQAALFAELIKRATEWKLLPAAHLYMDTVRNSWEQIIPICGAVFKHLSEQGLSIPFDDYPEFAQLYLQKTAGSAGFRSTVLRLPKKMLEAYRAIGAHGSMRNLSSRYFASQIVYSAVPLLFLCYGAEPQVEYLHEARAQLAKLGELDQPREDVSEEWDYLRKKLFVFWKMYCY